MIQFIIIKQTDSEILIWDLELENLVWNDLLLNFLQMIFMNLSVVLDFVSALKTMKGFIIMTRHM